MMNCLWLISHPPERRDETRPIRVLLADDHPILREGLANILEGEPDIEVVAEASDGLEAMELARAYTPDVVVMDVTMPRMSGIESARRVSAEFPGIRIIALSIHERADMAAAMREAGAETYLTKDGPPELLIAAIRGEHHSTPSE